MTPPPANDVPALAHHWDTIYAERQSDELSWSTDRPAPSLALVDDLIASGQLRQDARVIDVGAGLSTFAADLQERGITHISIADISRCAIERAQRRLSGADLRFVVADVRDGGLPAAMDLWHDRAVFHFQVAAEDVARYRSALHATLRYGGHAIVWTFASDGPVQCSGLPTQRYEGEELADALGMELISASRHLHPKPSGGSQAFTIALLRR